MSDLHLSDRGALVMPLLCTNKEMLARRCNVLKNERATIGSELPTSEEIRIGAGVPMASSTIFADG